MVTKLLSIPVSPFLKWKRSLSIIYRIPGRTQLLLKLCFGLSAVVLLLTSVMLMVRLTVWNVRSQEQLPRSFVLLSVLMMTLSLLILVLSLEIPHSTQLVKVNHWNISRDGMSMVSKENGWVIYYL